MKHLSLVLALSLVAFIATFSIATADSYDSDTATIQKKGAHTAKVMIDKKTFTASICFKEGASWDNVKDHYKIAPSTASALESGKMCIAISPDGKASFMKSSCSRMKK